MRGGSTTTTSGGGGYSLWGMTGGLLLTATATALGAKAFDLTRATRVKRNTVGFFHPVANDGGGGERVRKRREHHEGGGNRSNMSSLDLSLFPSLSLSPSSLTFFFCSG
mmetsp:Transcript_13036/g.36572  ORF Transcript_13036/g.36572 Transcript_13036/m.36572 type:complete len:109 (-) Transcript_13036:1543-1869(-)